MKKCLLSLILFTMTLASCGVSTDNNGNANSSGDNSNISNNTSGKYTITFDLNGGSGSFEALKTDDKITIPETKPTLDSYHFVGWNTFNDKKTYYPGDEYQASKDTTLYALFTDAIVCADCKGERFRNAEVSCKECGGDGHYDNKIKQTCSDCNGRGRYYGNDPCPTCGGSKYSHTSFRCNYCYSTWSSPYTSPITTCPSCHKGGAHITGHTTCSTCSGSGWVNGYIDCEVCHGTGQEEVYESCKKCEGTGKVHQYQQCEHCYGLGYSVWHYWHNNPVENNGPRYTKCSDHKLYINVELSSKFEWQLKDYSDPADDTDWGNTAEFTFETGKLVDGRELPVLYHLWYREKETSEKTFGPTYYHVFTSTEERSEEYYNELFSK